MKAQFDSFLKKCQDLVTKDGSGGILSVNEGRRYLKIVVTTGTQISVFAFVDKTNGDVLKPATFKAPAANARGNILDATNGMGRMTSFGPEYDN